MMICGLLELRFTGMTVWHRDFVTFEYSLKLLQLDERMIRVHEIFKKCLRSVKWSLPWLDARSNDQLYLSGCCHTQAKQCGSDPSLTSSPQLYCDVDHFLYCIYGKFKFKEKLPCHSMFSRFDLPRNLSRSLLFVFWKCYSRSNKMPWELVPSTVKGGFWFCRIDKINGVLTAWLPPQGA